jgi:hypothetical protein
MRRCLYQSNIFLAALYLRRKKSRRSAGGATSSAMQKRSGQLWPQPVLPSGLAFHAGDDAFPGWFPAVDARDAGREGAGISLTLPNCRGAKSPNQVVAGQGSVYCDSVLENKTSDTFAQMWQFAMNG